MAKVFLSYASEDREEVKNLYGFLKTRGFDPWMDVMNLRPGERWEFSIRRAIRDCDVVIVFLSPHAVTKRGFFQKEVRQALDICDEKLEEDIFLIPVVLEDCQVPEKLSVYQWIRTDKPGWGRDLVAAINSAVSQLSDIERLSSHGTHVVTGEDIRDVFVGYPGYEIELSLPQVVIPENGDVESQINKIIQGRILNMATFVRRDYLTQDRKFYEKYNERQTYNGLWVDYTVYRADETIVSICLNHSWYGAGAAHPQHHSLPLNFYFTPLIDLGLEFVFQVNDGALQEIADKCASKLRKLPEFQDADENWLREGLSPKDENFEAFSLANDHVVFHFDPYQIGPYALGTHHVRLKYSELSNALCDNELVKALKGA